MWLLWVTMAWNKYKNCKQRKLQLGKIKMFKNNIIDFIEGHLVCIVLSADFVYTRSHGEHCLVTL